MPSSLPNTPSFRAACAIVARLRAAGFAAYLAGGCVRDLLLGHTPHDYDVATSARPEVVLDLFPQTFAVGAHFGVVLVVEDRANKGADGGQKEGREAGRQASQEAGSQASQEASPQTSREVGREARLQTGRETERETGPETSPETGLPTSPQAGPETDLEQPRPRMLTEVATFRSDGLYLDGRRPEQVTFADRAEDDVARRDFTINGLLLDPACWQRTGSLEQSVLDFVGGRADLQAGLVRAIGEPRARFAEDKLRMLRAIRFAARLDYQLEAQTEAAIAELAPKIVQVSRERVRDELTRMLTEGRARRAFELLDATGLLAAVLPEVARLRGVEQPPQYHPEGDVWTHTLLLLDGLAAGCSPTLAWGALLHDIGKPATFERAADRIRFHGHVEVGVKIAAEICNRLRFSRAQTEQILALVANHMRFGEVHRMKPSTLKRFFRFHDFAEHLELHRLDALASRGDLSHYYYAQEHYAALPEESIRPVLLVTGRDLIAAGYRPGPEFRRWLALVEDAQLEGRVQSREQGLEMIAEAASLPKP